MRKYKENPKYNVISIRLNDKEKAFLTEMLRDTRKSVSMLMREAMNQYTSYITGSSSGAKIH
jgi:predicted transcriptional regulator